MITFLIPDIEYSGTEYIVKASFIHGIVFSALLRESNLSRIQNSRENLDSSRYISVWSKFRIHTANIEKNMMKQN